MTQAPCDPTRGALHEAVLAALRAAGLGASVHADPDATGPGELAVVGALGADALRRLQGSLAGGGLGIATVDTPSLQGAYLETASGVAGLLVAPKAHVAVLTRDVLNHSLNVKLASELKAFGERAGIPRLAGISIRALGPLWGTLKVAIAEQLQLTPRQVLFAEYENNYREFEDGYRALGRDQRSPLPLDERGNLSHIEHFAWLYFWELKLIASLTRARRLTVHDAGTCMAYFPLLLASLPPGELFGLEFTEIVASDLHVEGQEHAAELIRRDGRKGVTFVNVDLLRDIARVPETDVTIANDLLEHLGDDTLAFQALQGLWERTRELLIVHVPYEKTPDPTWGHFVAFDGAKLRTWASRLPGVHFVFDEDELARRFGARGGAPTSLDGGRAAPESSGFLVLRRSRAAARGPRAA